MTVALRIGGHWHSPRTHTPPVYETKVDGGMGDASFSLLLPSDAVPLGVERDALVEMIEDSQRVYLGRINGIDPANWGIKCRGIGTDLDEVPALTETGALTRDVEVAIATAKAAPFNVTINNSRGVSGLVMGDSSEPVMVGHLLELLAEQETVRWGVDADWQLYLRDDPTEPQWIIHAPDLGLTDEGGAPYNMYAGRYVDYTTGLYATAYSVTPPTGKIKVANVDLTKRGQMSPLHASIILNHLAKQTRDTPTWGSTITVTPSQIRTMGMQPADPSSVLGGHMARMIGLTASQQAVAGGEYLDVVLSSVVRDSGPDSLTIAPVGSLPTTIEEALAAIA